MMALLNRSNRKNGRNSKKKKKIILEELLVTVSSRPLSFVYYETHHNGRRSYKDITEKYDFLKEYTKNSIEGISTRGIKDRDKYLRDRDTKDYARELEANIEVFIKNLKTIVYYYNKALGKQVSIDDELEKDNLISDIFDEIDERYKTHMAKKEEFDNILKDILRTYEFNFKRDLSAPDEISNEELTLDRKLDVIAKLYESEFRKKNRNIKGRDKKYLVSKEEDIGKRRRVLKSIGKYGCSEARSRFVGKGVPDWIITKEFIERALEDYDSIKAGKYSDTFSQHANYTMRIALSFDMVDNLLNSYFDRSKTLKEAVEGNNFSASFVSKLGRKFLQYKSIDAKGRQEAFKKDFSYSLTSNDYLDFVDYLRGNVRNKESRDNILQFQPKIQSDNIRELPNYDEEQTPVEIVKAT